MAELIKKSELEKSMTEDWLLENLAAQDSKSSIRKDIENVIDNLPTTSEAELRASVIDEFAESVITEMECFAREQEGEPNVGFIDSCVDIVRYALQMKGEKE